MSCTTLSTCRAQLSARRCSAQPSARMHRAQQPHVHSPLTNNKMGPQGKYFITADLTSPISLPPTLLGSPLLLTLEDRSHHPQNKCQGETRDFVRP
ncbi:hypothetical protein L2E82_47081 [Cichorium intybus]|uniref:Uncharacterized protein n=1 Tax=Cichorium intybus TaxID=13427 RepID=A0ACB8YUD1_CICIN|nr:hypothetical protein L2E82_47081 [Cichorium intybus]